MVNRINLQLITTDLLVQNRPAMLQLRIQGNGINAQSAPIVSGIPPIYLNGGEILSLTSADLAGYFRFQNLQGITTTRYSEPLPDGVYTICFQVYDMVTKKWLSQNSCATIYLMLNDPPQLNVPSNNEQIASSDFPNIIFSWTPRHMNATNVSYEFELKEILNTNLDPAFAFEVSPLLHKEEGLRTTTLLYDISKPVLIPGKTYAWRVKAISTNGLAENSVFKNNGYSQIYSFKYASNCIAPRYLLSEQQSISRVKIMWQGENAHRKYHVQYRKAHVDNAEWFETYTVNTQALLQDLEPGFTYEFRVGATCEAEQYGVTSSYIYSGIQTFSIDASENATVFNCGIVPEIEIANQQPLPDLIINETFMAGDFPVKVLEISGSNGVYSGKGFIEVPYLFFVKIGVEFTSIRINTDYKLIDGVVETTYDPEWGNIIDVTDLVEDIKAIGEEFIKIYDELLNGDLKDKNDQEKQEILNQNEYQVEKYIKTIDDLLNSGVITNEEAQVLKDKLIETKDCLESGLNCEEETVAVPETNSGPFTGNYYFFDCTAEWKSCNEKAKEIANKIKALVEKRDELIGVLTYSEYLSYQDNDEEDRFKFYLSPAGMVVVLPAEAIPSFSKELENPEIKDLIIPDGALTGFTLNDQYYAGRYRKIDGKWRFEGYRHCITRDENGDCSKDRFYTDINKQYQQILEKILDKDESVLTTLNKSSFNDVYLSVGFATTVSNQAITAQIEALIAQNLGRYGATIGQGASSAFKIYFLITLWDFLVTPSTIDTVGVGTLVPSLPIDLSVKDNPFEKDIPIDLPITIPHSYPQNSGTCKVYVIWKVSTSGEVSVAKYGMTCTEDYENECNMRPEKQCKKFDSENTKGEKFFYNWVTRDISKDICHVIEKSLTASYVILNKGELPSHHYLPCFIKKDEFQERVDRAEKWIEDKIKEYNK
ncbi:fibronectin type III domain-containing protein [Paenimyroides tangerinum]|uniref:Fibronectin type III domain-containing protein n=1 Tax=Paenimyroides tangerinum TaxID=2488728 RepID=A0A3P3VX42_9FLAO|nr:fibronectin type III domain-containing protein [Paenimyroides tangerinum]RRJ86917.1 fibronectin type III domain-containing protein [Paenimyroides tangerinum]